VSFAWLVGHLLGPVAIGAAGAATVAWLVVLAMPRAGWLGLGAALLVAGIAQGRAGGALVIMLAALLPVGLLPRRGVLWPLPAAAPVLGMIGLAGAWPAVAARAGRTAWQRASLSAIGYLWLLTAAPLAGQDLYVRRPPGTPAPDDWTASLSVAFHDVLGPILSSGALAAASVWAIAALVLPHLVRQRSLAADAVLVTVWAAVTVSATETVIAAGGYGMPPSAVAGALASAAVALSPTVVTAWRGRARSGSPHPELP
jgi:hypothetical protein